MGTLEYLLGSSTEAGTVATSLSLGSFSLVPGLLMILWTLSPVGGQAALRVVSKADKNSTTAAIFSSVNFMSPYELHGPTVQLNPGIYAAINALFASALLSASKLKSSGQDAFGNIKVPLLEALPTPKTVDGWIPLPANANVIYSALNGLRTNNIEQDGTSSWNMETTYMYADCKLSHHIISLGEFIAHQNETKYPGIYSSGANFNVIPGPQFWWKLSDDNPPPWGKFTSFAPAPR